MKKIILTVFAATSLLLYSTPSFAISLSVGVPVSHHSLVKKTGESYGNALMELVDISLVWQLPFGLGLGMDSHKTKI